MNEKINYGYIELTFPEKIKKQFFDFVENNVSSELLYKSDVITRINGNVAMNLHLTLYYGIPSELIDSEELKSLIDNIKIEKIETGDFIAIRGFQGMYKILCLEVNDSNSTLKEYSDKIRDLIDPERIRKYDFIPHLTLAYVNSDFDLLSIKTSDLPKIIESDEVRISI